MTPERTKRGPEIEDKTRKVKQKRPLKPLTLVIIVNMEPVKLEMCWTPAQHKGFRTAQMYEFLHRSDNLPSIEKELVEEYMKNYDPSDGSSVVNGRIIKMMLHYHKMVVYKTCIKTNLDVKLPPVILDLSLLGLVFSDTFEKGAKMTLHAKMT